VERGVRGLRVGLPREYFFDALEPGVASALDALVERLRRAGARVRDVTLPASDAFYSAMFDPIAVSEIRATYAREWQTRPDAFSKDFATVFDGVGPSPSTVATAREARDAFQRSVEGVLADVDLLLTPTVPLVAPRIDGPIDGMRILRNTWAFNAARVPAVSIPCGTGDVGLPVGVQLVGRPRGEAALLGVGTAIERLIDPTARQPRP
jgi:aspartyl-tRNA(Asn)/glutamyl-tRNA(Gln) amidotransferase subunit A